MATFISHSPEETLLLGRGWGERLELGWVIALRGDLGAGKTQLVKGIALGLGITRRVHSPTFSLVNEYRDGRLPLFHLDLYRLHGPEQIYGAGLHDYLSNPDGITVVEWAERWLGETFPKQRAATESLPVHLRWVTIESTDETTRLFAYEDFGS